MKVLLDTQVLLWWFVDSSVLCSASRELITDMRNTVYVSAVSLWEIAIKRSLGKLDVPDGLPDLLERECFMELSVQSRHAWHIHTLPHHHRDPFDRLLIAQAKLEHLPIMTRDAMFSRYDIDLLEA